MSKLKVVNEFTVDLRQQLKITLLRVLGQQSPDHMIVINLMGACAYAFSYPQVVSEEDKEVLRNSYVQLRTEGHI